jgi:hypothetical protein
VFSSNLGSIQIIMQVSHEEEESWKMHIEVIFTYWLVGVRENGNVEL